METQGNDVSTGHTKRWLRVLRPLLWWLLLVFILYIIRLHHELSSHTHLNFQITLAGQPAFGATATLDGQPMMSGQWIAIGSHRFSVTHPKGDTFATNLYFGWYGEHNLGVINLPRSHGMLSIAVNPPANAIIIVGPEFSLTLDDSSGTNLLVPTDMYQVEARYRHWQKKMESDVFAGQTTPINFAPQFGALRLDCNQPDATYQLQTTAGQTVVAGVVPSLTTQLAAGDYTLNTQHHGHQRRVRATVKADATNAVNCDFQYGAAVIETSPAGVAVIRQNQNWGETPLTVNELLPGEWHLTLQKPGYQSLDVSLVVTANQTNFVSTNLLSETYFHALSAAQNALAAEDFDHALSSASAALTAKPNDVAAMALQRQAVGLRHLQRAKTLAQANDFIAAGKELRVAQQTVPDNAEINALLLVYQQQEPAQLERERIERLARPKKVFDEYSSKLNDAELFESHELMTDKPVEEVVSAIVDSLEHQKPVYEVTDNTLCAPETYAIVANQSDNNVITTTGERKCLIVVGRASATETRIYFRVLEYKSKHNVSMPGLLAFKDNLEFVPINLTKIPDFTDKLKAQIQTGVSNLTARIQGAIK